MTAISSNTRRPTADDEPMYDLQVWRAFAAFIALVVMLGALAVFMDTKNDTPEGVTPELTSAPVLAMGTFGVAFLAFYALTSWWLPKGNVVHSTTPSIEQRPPSAAPAAPRAELAPPTRYEVVFGLENALKAKVELVERCGDKATVLKSDTFRAKDHVRAGDLKGEYTTLAEDR